MRDFLGLLFSLSSIILIYFGVIFSKLVPFGEKVSFIGNQKKVIEAILNNQYEVGVIRTGMLEVLSSKGLIDISNLKVINEQQLLII